MLLLCCGLPSLQLNYNAVLQMPLYILFIQPSDGQHSATSRALLAIDALAHSGATNITQFLIKHVLQSSHSSEQLVKRVFFHFSTLGLEPDQVRTIAWSCDISRSVIHEQ